MKAHELAGILKSFPNVEVRVDGADIYDVVAFDYEDDTYPHVEIYI